MDKSLHYHELMGKNKKEKKCLMVDDYMWIKVLDKIEKIIDVEKFDYTKILIDTDDKLPDDITLKNVMLWITCDVKGNDKLIRVSANSETN